MYKASLTLFTSTLDIKHMHEVRDYQEFFLKVHAILLFVLGSNLSGMIPYSTTITSSLMNTLFLSLAVFINIVLTIIKEKGVNYFFGLFMPAGCPIGLILLLIPIEVISYSFRLVSLSVRLFANMMAGHTLLKVIVGFS
jgi:F-type H+-transporting ATPase subunit a